VRRWSSAGPGRRRAFATDKLNQFRTKVYDQPVHYQRQGRWDDIDTTLVERGRGRFGPRGTPVDVEVADKHDDAALARMNIDEDHSIEFGLAGAAAGTTRPDQDKITYQGIRPHTDLEVTAQAEGLKEDLVLASRQAPDPFVFPLKLKGLVASLDAEGQVLYKDGAGRVRAVTPKGFMEDARVDPQSDEGATSLGVSFALVGDGRGASALEVRLDRAWLDDPARVYPVRADPSLWQPSTWEDDTYVMSNFTRDNAFDYELKVGTYDGGYHLGRSFMNFDVSPLNGKAIDSATFWVHNFHSWSCSPRGMGVYRVLHGWGGHTMTGYPGAALGEQVAWAAFAMGYEAGGCPGNWAGFNVTGAVRNWTAGVWGQFGLAMAVDPVSERDNYAWKKFGSWNAANALGNGAYPHIDIYWSEPPNPFGSWEQAGSAPDNKMRVKGWAIDPDTAAPINVDVWGATS
jgi:hypothetical protein